MLLKRPPVAMLFLDSAAAYFLRKPSPAYLMCALEMLSSLGRKSDCTLIESGPGIAESPRYEPGPLPRSERPKLRFFLPG